MNDPSQKIQPLRQGDVITAAMLRQIVDKVLRSVIGGQGCIVQRIGDQAVINVTALPAAGGGGGGGAVYTAATKAGLVDASTVPETSFARVTAGADKGTMYVVNPEKTGWTAFNFFE